MIKFNQELENLKKKKIKIENEIKNCCCNFGGFENGQMTNNVCFICPDRQKEIDRINKRIIKIQNKENN